MLFAFPATASAGSSEELVLPPAPSCATPVFTTAPIINSDGYNASSPEIGDGVGGLPTRVLMSGVSFESGTVSIDEVITWDAHIDRATNLDQDNERVLFEFSLDGAVVATSALTTDLVEGPVSAWEIDNLGLVDLPGGADAVSIVHAGGTAAINSVVVTGVCMTFTPTPVPDPEPEPEPVCDDDPATPEPAGGCDLEPDPEPEPEPVCDDDPATPEPAGGCPDPDPTPSCDDDPATPDPAEGCDLLPEPDPDPDPDPTPGGGDQDPPPLAITGAYSDTMAASAMILMILGGSAVFVARRNET